MTTNSESITALFFDWDGTIVDSAHLGLAAFEQSFASLGLKFDLEVYRSVYSPNWYSLYEAMGVPKDKWDSADELWNHHYAQQTAELIPGAKETIDRLREKGYRLGVVSSGNDCRVKREITSACLDDAFEVIVCSEQMQNKKPHPEGLETAMTCIHVSPEESAYVGDSPEDIEMGKRAGILTVGVRSAYPTNWKLRNHAPDIYIESLTELSDHF
jgi:HAD superfamily hydrolase (TIGR01509 family)